MEHPSGDGAGPGLGQPRAFATTHWSLVACAGDTASPGSREALRLLCRAYWYPLYGFARRTGLAPADAEDATQGFFEHLLESDGIARADPARGRFRTFLLSSFRNFLGHQRARAGAQKRGGGAEIVSIDAMQAAEQRLRDEPAARGSTEAEFDRRWALELLDRVFEDVRQDYTAGGQGVLFDELRAALWGIEEGHSYATIAARVSSSEGAVKMAAMRLRRRVREALRAEVSKSLLDPGDADQELRHLLAALDR